MYRSKFQISCLVMGIHLVLIFLFSSPLYRTKPNTPKKIVVVTKRPPPKIDVYTSTTKTHTSSEGIKTVTLESSTGAKKKTVISPLKAKPEAQKNLIKPKKPVPKTKQVLQKMDQNRAKMESTTTAKKKLYSNNLKNREFSKSVPSNLFPPKDAVETKSALPEDENEDIFSLFMAKLCDTFEKNLILPEKGAVKLTITVQANGKIDKIKTITVESEKNLHYLETILPLLTLPLLPHGEKEIECVITFCDESL